MPASASVTVYQSTALAYNGDTSVDCNDSATLSATLTLKPQNTGLAGQTVTFSVGRGKSCSGVTDSNGLAQCSLTFTSKQSPTVTASFSGALCSLLFCDACYRAPQPPTTTSPRPILPA